MNQFTKTFVANQALALLGAQSVSDVDTASGTPSSLIRNIWDATIMEVQADFPWQELVTRAEFVPDIEGDIDDYDRYLLPGDCIRVLTVGEYRPETLAFYSVIDFRIEANYLICDNSGGNLRIEYVKLSDTPGSWSVDLAKAIWHCLAYKLAMPLTQNPQLQANMFSLFQQVMKQSKRRASVSSHSTLYLPRTYRGRWADERRR